MDADSLCDICVEECVRERVGCEARTVYWIFKVQAQAVSDTVERFAIIYLENCLITVK